MKCISLSALLFLCCCVCFFSSAQEDASVSPLNEKMITFKTACLTERTALKTKNQITMGKALKLFKTLHTGAFKYSVESSFPSDALGEPVIQFSPEYCDHLMRTEFSIIPLDSLEALRETFLRTDLLSRSFSLKAESRASLAVKASGNCAMMAISEENLPLNISVCFNGISLQFNSEENGTVNWLTWTLPKEIKTEVLLNIENPNPFPVSFTIALQ